MEPALRGRLATERGDVSHLLHPHDEKLAEVLQLHKLLCGVVASAEGEIVAQVGDVEASGCKDIFSALLGPYGNARTTFESLVGQLLPRIWSQGEVFAFIDRPSDNLMVIVFGKGGTAVEHYHLSKQVSETIAERWLTTGCS